MKVTMRAKPTTPKALGDKELVTKPKTMRESAATRASMSKKIRVRAFGFTGN
jgi:hypothetical protein